MQSLVGFFIIHFRWIFVCIFLMPASLLFDVLFRLRNWLEFKFQSAPEKHRAKVEEIKEQVKAWNCNGRRTRMCTGREGWLTVSLRQGRYKETLERININLIDVLEVNKEKRYVTAEPLVTMGQLTATLVPLGWTIPVVPELDDLTIGGLIMGCGIETSSHRYGLFQETCIGFDVITPDGELHHCSKDENSDLFYSIPWSHGTLCFLVSAQIQIIPTKRYVKLRYLPYTNKEAFVERFAAEAKNASHDFLECLVYDKDNAVVMIGDFADYDSDEEVNEIGKFWKPWFFEHVRTILYSGDPKTELIPLRDYYHRHTKSLFWELQDIIPFGNNILFRHIFGWTMPPKISLLKLTSPKSVLDLYENHHVIQDMLVPMEVLDAALKFFDNTLRLYPLWLCPMKLIKRDGFVHPCGDDDEMYVDIGAYGSPKVKDFKGPLTIRKLEKFVLEHKGFQMLYADSYLTREDFEEMFDHKKYRELRIKYGCLDAFPEVYDKVSRGARK